MSQEKYDPYDVDDKFLDEVEKTINQRQFSGVWCPWKNDKKPCAICRDVRKLWNMHNDTELEKSQYSERARKFQASASVFMNIVFPENPSEVRIMQCGIKMLQAIVNGVKYQDWGPVWHPNKGMSINVVKSTDSGFNTYTPSPDIKKGVRALADKSVLDNLYNLDLIADLMDTVDIFNINTIEKNRKVSFDILPGWSPENRRRFFNIIYYHYNVGPEAITEGIPDLFGKSEKDMTMDDLPTNEPDYPAEESPTQETTEQETMAYSVDNAPGCFGKFYSEGDPQCQDASCDSIRQACAETFEKNQKAARDAARG